MTSRENTLAELGQLLITWNQTEDQLRMLLMEICGGQTVANRILTAELSGMTLASALRAAANSLLPRDLADDVIATAIRFDALRDHRNHFVHGAKGVEKDPPHLLLMLRSTARSKLTEHHEQIVDIEIQDCTELTAQVGVIASLTIDDVRCALAGKPYTSPRKPEWHPLPKIGSRKRR